MNYYIKTDVVEQSVEEVLQEVKISLGNYYLNASRDDRIAFYVPFGWYQFMDILNEARMSTAEIDMFGKVHRMKTLNGGFIHIFTDKDLTEEDRGMNPKIMKGFRFTQAAMFDCRKLDQFIVGSISQRIYFKI